MTFAERLKAVREKRGLTQREMVRLLEAQQVDITPETYNRWENGHREPDANARRWIEHMVDQIETLPLAKD